MHNRLHCLQALQYIRLDLELLSTQERVRFAWTISYEHVIR